MSALTDVVTGLGETTAAVWSAVELIGKHIPKLDKSLAGIILGPTFAVLAYRYHYVSVPAPLEGLKAYGAAAFGGLVATLLSQLFHDYVSKPIATKLNGTKPPEGP